MLGARPTPAYLAPAHFVPASAQSFLKASPQSGDPKRLQPPTPSTVAPSPLPSPLGSPQEKKDPTPPQRTAADDDSTPEVDVFDGKTDRSDMAWMEGRGILTLTTPPKCGSLDLDIEGLDDYLLPRCCLDILRSPTTLRPPPSLRLSELQWRLESPTSELYCLPKPRPLGLVRPPPKVRFEAALLSRGASLGKAQACSKVLATVVGGGVFSSKQLSEATKLLNVVGEDKAFLSTLQALIKVSRNSTQDAEVLHFALSEELTQANLVLSSSAKKTILAAAQNIWGWVTRPATTTKPGSTPVPSLHLSGPSAAATTCLMSSVLGTLASASEPGGTFTELKLVPIVECADAVSLEWQLAQQNPLKSRSLFLSPSNVLCSLSPSAIASCLHFDMTVLQEQTKPKLHKAIGTLEAAHWPPTFAVHTKMLVKSLSPKSKTGNSETSSTPKSTSLVMIDDVSLPLPKAESRAEVLFASRTTVGLRGEVGRLSTSRGGNESLVMSLGRKDVPEVLPGEAPDTAYRNSSLLIATGRSRPESSNLDFSLVHDMGGFQQVGCRLHEAQEADPLAAVNRKWLSFLASERRGLQPLWLLPKDGQTPIVRRLLAASSLSKLRCLPGRGAADEVLGEAPQEFGEFTNEAVCPHFVNPFGDADPTSQMDWEISGEGREMLLVLEELIERWE